MTNVGHRKDGLRAGLTVGDRRAGRADGLRIAPMMNLEEPAVELNESRPLCHRNHRGDRNVRWTGRVGVRGLRKALHDSTGRTRSGSQPPQ